MVAIRCSFRLVPYLQRAAIKSICLKFNQNNSKTVRQIFLQLPETRTHGYMDRRTDLVRASSCLKMFHKVANSWPKLYTLFKCLQVTTIPQQFVERSLTPLFFSCFCW